MRSSLAVAGLAVLVACGGDRGTSVATDDTGSTGTTAPTGDGSTTADETDGEPPFDRSQCEPDLSGQLEWSVSLPSTVQRGGGIDIARASSDSVYVVDGCLSRWDAMGFRRWEVQDPEWICAAMDVTPEGEPVVVGMRTTAAEPVALVVAFDDDGTPRWGAPSDEEPTGDPPADPPDDEPAPSVQATDIVIDGDGRIYVAGLARLAGEQPWPWLSRLDPDDGRELWTLELEPGELQPPRLTLADGLPVLALGQDRGADIHSVELRTFDPEGEERSRWSSLDDLGMPLQLIAHDGDHDGSMVVLGRDPSLPSPPQVLLLLDSLGNPRWIRSGLDVSWLREQAATVALDPCGSVMLAGAGDPAEASWGHLWLLKLDRAAEPRWSHYVPAPYFSADSVLRAIAIEPDGGVLATGAQVTDVQEFDDQPVVFMDAWAGRIMP